jgi:hypothetical protein
MLPHAARKHPADAEALGNRRNVDILALEVERRLSCNDLEWPNLC